MYIHNVQPASPHYKTRVSINNTSFSIMKMERVKDSREKYVIKVKFVHFKIKFTIVLLDFCVKKSSDHRIRILLGQKVPYPTGSGSTTLLK